MKNLLFVFILIAGLALAGIDYATADTTVIQPDAAAGKDAWLNPNAGGTNYGTDTKLAVGAGALTRGTQARTLIQFDLSGIPSGSTIDSATLSLYCFGDNLNFGGGAGSAAAAVSVHKVTSAWDETTITNNSAPTFDSTATATTTVNAKNTWFSWDITSLVQAWFGGTATSYGMLLKTAQGAPSTWAFYSSDYTADATLRPKLTVTYTAGGGGNTPPTAVTLNNPTNVTNDSITLSWTQNNDPDFASYKIYRSISPGVDENSTLVGSISSRTTTSYTDTGLTAGATYYYKVYVVDTGGLRSGSNEINQKTTAIMVIVAITGTFYNIPLGQAVNTTSYLVDVEDWAMDSDLATYDQDDYNVEVTVEDPDGNLDSVVVKGSGTGVVLTQLKYPDDGNRFKLSKSFLCDIWHWLQQNGPTLVAITQLISWGQQQQEKAKKDWSPCACKLEPVQGYPTRLVFEKSFGKIDMGSNCRRVASAEYPYEYTPDTDLSGPGLLEPKWGDIQPYCGKEKELVTTPQKNVAKPQVLDWPTNNPACWYHNYFELVLLVQDCKMRCVRYFVKYPPGGGQPQSKGPFELGFVSWKHHQPGGPGITHEGPCYEDSGSGE